MLTDEERLRVYGGPAGVAAADRYIKELAASFPLLTPKQQARLAVLFRPVVTLPAQRDTPSQRVETRQAA